MTAWVILIGFGIAVLGVIAKVLTDVRRDLREDREAHGGHQTVAAARRAWLVIGIVLLLVLLLIVLPLLLYDADAGVTEGDAGALPRREAPR